MGKVRGDPSDPSEASDPAIEPVVREPVDREPRGEGVDPSGDPRGESSGSTWIWGGPAGP